MNSMFSTSNVGAEGGGVASAESHETSMGLFVVAVACGVWYAFILVVQGIGFTQL